MSTGRFVAPGKTRSCPHCRATILDSATVCPGCHHHLRFGSGAGQRAQEVVTPLRVEGTLRHPPEGGAWEYSVVLSIRNDRGEEIARQVVGVGALHPSEARAFALAVEVFKPAEAREPKPEAPDPRSPGRPGAPGARPEPVRPPLAARDGQPRPGAAHPGQPAATGQVASGARPLVTGQPPGAGQPVNGQAPAPTGAGGVTRPGLPPVRPAAAPRDEGLLRPRSGSPFKDPRLPGGGSGLQPKRR